MGPLSEQARLVANPQLQRGVRVIITDGDESEAPAGMAAAALIVVVMVMVVMAMV